MHDSSRCLLPSVFICFPRAMGSRTTNNSRQTAPSLPPASVGEDVIPPARRDNVANADQFVDRPSETASAAITVCGPWTGRKRRERVFLTTEEQ